MAAALASDFFDFDVPADFSELEEDVVAVDESDDEEVVVESLALSGFASAFFFDDVRLSVL